LYRHLGSESVVTMMALANNVSVFPLVASFAPNACGGFGFVDHKCDKWENKQGSGLMWESKTEINLLFNKGRLSYYEYFTISND
jgi:hypothetical protein